MTPGDLPTPVRLVAYAGVLAVVFGAAFGLGRAADPVTTVEETAHEEAAAPGARGRPAPRPVEAPAGLAVSQDDYTLVPAAATLPAGRDMPFRFTVTGPDGRAARHFTPTHTKDLHLIVVRRDLTGFQHVHPTAEPDGSWTVPLDVEAAGTYRVFADFQPAGRDAAMTLGADLAVAGPFRPVALPAAAATTEVDGYTVEVAGPAVAGRESQLTFGVTRGGDPVRTVQPYLGAFGHLVSLRAGDLAYLHTHPTEDAGAGQRGGPEIRFRTEFPTAGRYRLYLDFQVGGVVRTAEFTVDVAAGSAARPGTGKASRSTEKEDVDDTAPDAGHGH